MVDQFGRWYPDFPGQQPWQDPAYIRATSAAPAGAVATAPQQQQTMTPPTIRAEIVQVESQEAIDRCSQNPGTTQMYMTKDEQNIIVRTKLANGEHTDVVYDKRPPAPPEPKINPADYVRRDELESLIAEMIRKEEEKNGTV